MYVFSYDPQTLAFVGGIPAEFDQLEPGRLLCPAFASRTPIPRFDSAAEWPFYVSDAKDPEAGSWELRKIVPDEPTPEKPVIDTAPAAVQAADIIVAMKLHLRAAELLRDQIGEVETQSRGEVASE